MRLDSNKGVAENSGFAPTGAQRNSALKLLFCQAISRSGFPTGIQNVTWSAAFSTDTPGVTLQWQWGAAVYTSFSTAYATGTTSATNNTLGVNAEDGTDPAGTPENFKQYVTFGGTGGGLANYTGYFSTGAGIVPTIAPVSISPSSLQFPTQNQSNTTASPLTAVVTNNDSTTYSIARISISGTNAGDFALVSGGANNCLTTSSLASGASCTLYATFTPTNVGTRSARILVYDGASNSPQTVYLTGTGQ